LLSKEYVLFHEYIELDEHGNVLDGHHRLKICEELGILEYPTIVRSGMTDGDKRLHARKLNMARRQLTQDQQRMLLQEQLVETPEKSDRQIAAGLGVSHTTVGIQRKELERRGRIDHVDKVVDTLGREQPRQRKEMERTLESSRFVTSVEPIDNDVKKRIQSTRNLSTNQLKHAVIDILKDLPQEQHDTVVQEIVRVNNAEIDRNFKISNKVWNLIRAGFGIRVTDEE
jgi:ParB-like chromosome segregation protein Spo0J